MRKLIWLMLIIATLATSLFLVANVHASTPVSGTINQDTTWAQANSPYLLTGIVVVNPGVTLTIEPGTTLDLAQYSISVGGTLNAVGTIENPIIFQTSYQYMNIRIQFLPTSTSWNPTLSTGCIVENTVFNSVSLSVSNSSPKVSNNYFTNNQYTAITVSGNSPLITKNAFDTRGSCITTYSGFSGSPIISSNFIKSSSNIGIGATNNVYVSDNNITGCYYGIYATGNATITRNLITSNTYGIMTSVNTATIEFNTVASNSYGLNGGGTIRNNAFGNNQIAVTQSIANSTFTQNNFFGNTQYNLRLSLTTAVDASNNWWGTTDASAINQTISDSKNNPAIGTVNFIPFLNQPNPQAPAAETVNYVPAPTPNPYPTTIPAPTPTSYPTIPLTPRPTVTSGPIATLTPTPIPTATPTPTPTPLPTPSPTPKIMPGSPLSLGGQSFAEAISQFDLTQLVQLVLMALGIMWTIVISAYVGRHFGQKLKKK